jgi:hypothetical protein
MSIDGFNSTNRSQNKEILSFGLDLYCAVLEDTGVETKYVENIRSLLLKEMQQDRECP